MTDWPDWTVLLIGGPSGCGKTTLGLQFASRCHAGLFEVDDLLLGIQAVTTDVQQPALHHWLTTASGGLNPTEILAAQIALAAALEPAIVAVVSDHLVTGSRMVIEGDYLLPATAARLVAGRETGCRVRAAFIREPHIDQLAANLMAREPDEGVQDARAMANAEYGEWLTDEAKRHGVPTLDARPWSTLADRLMGAIEGL